MEDERGRRWDHHHHHREERSSRSYEDYERRKKHSSGDYDPHDQRAILTRKRSDDEGPHKKSKKIDDNKDDKKDEYREPSPANSEEEDERGEQNGPRNYHPLLWTKLLDPPKDRPCVDIWEFRMEGEFVTMTFVVDGEKYPMYFGSRTPVDFTMRSTYWIPRHSKVFQALRCRLFTLPKNTTFNKVIFYNFPECMAEDCLLEFMFIKKWTARQFEYNLCCEFSQPQHLRKLVHMFKPQEITVNLNFGPYIHSTSNTHDPINMHNHLAVNFDLTVTLERDYQRDCQKAMNHMSGEDFSKLAGKSVAADNVKKDKDLLPMYYGEAGRGKIFGQVMLRTLCALRKFVSMMADRKMAQVKGMTLRKFIINGPSNDKMCNKLFNLLKEDGIEESNKKRAAYAVGDRIYVCVRSDLRRAQKYSLAMPASAFKMDINNEQLLGFTKTVPIFHCLFRTNVDQAGAVRLIEEWHRNERQFDDLQIHVDKVIEPDFINHLKPDYAEKKIKLRRFTPNGRHTLYIERDRLATRHLSLRVTDITKTLT